MSDLIVREDAIKALRLEYPMMPLFKAMREEWALRSEGFRKAEAVIMKLPSVDAVSLEEFEQMRFLADKSMEMVGEDRPKGEWLDCAIPLEDGGSMPIQVCSLCKTFYPLAFTGGGHRFCPNCGASMREREGE